MRFQFSCFKALKALPHECFFWGTHSGAELDLLIIHGGKRLGFEFKYSDAPRLTSSMKTAMELLSLDQLTVIYPGPDQYRLSENINVCSLEYVCTNQGAPCQTLVKYSYVNIASKY